MMTLYKHDPETGALVPYAEPFNAMLGLIGSAESIGAIVEREMLKLPPDAKRFDFEITSNLKDTVTVVAGFRSADNWTVILAGEFKKDDRVVRLQIGKSF